MAWSSVLWTLSTARDITVEDSSAGAGAGCGKGRADRKTGVVITCDAVRGDESVRVRVSPGWSSDGSSACAGTTQAESAQSKTVRIFRMGANFRVKVRRGKPPIGYFYVATHND